MCDTYDYEIWLDPVTPKAETIRRGLNAAHIEAEDADDR